MAGADDRGLDGTLAEIACALDRRNADGIRGDLAAIYRGNAERLLGRRTVDQ